MPFEKKPPSAAVPVTRRIGKTTITVSPRLAPPPEVRARNEELLEGLVQEVIPLAKPRVERTWRDRTTATGAEGFREQAVAWLRGEIGASLLRDLQATLRQPDVVDQLRREMGDALPPTPQQELEEATRLASDALVARWVEALRVAALKAWPAPVLLTGDFRPPRELVSSGAWEALERLPDDHPLETRQVIEILRGLTEELADTDPERALPFELALRRETGTGVLSVRAAQAGPAPGARRQEDDQGEVGHHGQGESVGLTGES